MFGKFVDKILHEDEEAINGVQKVEKEIEEAASNIWKQRLDVFITFLIFIIALGTRLYFLFYITDPQNPGDGWAGDAFHHWQIAYLTREVGLSHGFLRLWDLKGMEFFWGPLHPVLMISLFAITGSVSIVIPRVLSAVFGSLMLAVLYLVIRKYWNRQTALATSFLALSLPVAILGDTFGLLEPIGYFFLLLGVLILESSPLLAGILWVLASMVRAEAWIFSLLLLFFARRVLKKPGQLVQVFLGWTIPMLLYLKYLLDYTGNPIYPLWWNYLANAKGVWATQIIYTPYQLFIKPYLVVWFFISIALFMVLWWRDKTKGSIFILFALAIWIFTAGMMGLTHYLTGFQPWFWIIRFFQYPYIFLGFFISLIFFYSIPKLIPLLGKAYVSWVFWIPVLIIAVLYQFVFWRPIIEKYDSTRFYWERTKDTASTFASQYQVGRVLIPEGDPNITYALVYFNNIRGENIIGQMFDPFFYMEGDPYENWGEERDVVLKWIRDEDIRLILVYNLDDSRYLKLFQKEPDYFEYVKAVPNTELFIYRAYPERINF